MDSTLGAPTMIRPLAGLSVIEFEGIGPGPLAGRMLADLGAEVVAVVRPNKAALGDPGSPFSDQPLRRGKRMVTLDLKRPESVEKALGLELRFFEDPDFYDKLTRARREASSRPIALVTTAFGLVVAIPAVMSFNYFTNKVEAFDVEMDNSSSELVDYFIKQSHR